MFDPQSFLDMQVTDSNSTQAIPIPDGEYLGVADKVEVKQWSKKDDPSVSGLKLVVHWDLDDAALKELLGRDRVSIRQDIMLDLTESGSLDMGKGRNIGLGRLREACDLNAPGQPFAFSMIQGRMAKIATKQRVDGDNIFNDVKGVAKLA